MTEIIGLSLGLQERVMRAVFDPKRFSSIYDLFSGYSDRPRGLYQENFDERNRKIWEDDESVACLEAALYKGRTSKFDFVGARVHKINVVDTALDIVRVAVRPRVDDYGYSEDTEPGRTKALDLIQRNISLFEQRMLEERQFGTGKFLSIIKNLIIFGKSDHRHLGYTVLGRHLDELFPTDVDAKYSEWRTEALDAFALVASKPRRPSFEEDQEISRTARAKISSALQKLGESSDSDNYVLSLIGAYTTRSGIHQNEELNHVVKHFGLDPQLAIKNWVASEPGSRTGDVSDPVIRNLRSMSRLERDNKGICVFLNREFGIWDFARYPSEMLIEQYRQFENTQLPYGVILNPRDDWNGAFYGNPLIGNEVVLGDLFRQLEGRYLIRVVEAGDKVQIARMLRKLDIKYGKNHKISFAIVGGHGTESSIRFGSGEENKNTLQSNDFLDSRFPKNKSFLVNHPTIILASCSTGVERGIGQQLSERLGATVIAPDRPTFPSMISVQEVDGQLRFNVVYGFKEPGINKTYSSGKNLSGTGG